MLIEAGSKLVMIGDSITDCERGRPVGEGLFGAIGKGYVGLVDGLLGSIYPEKKIRVINMGTSGDTVRHLDARWKTDVTDLKPAWLSIMIGINDVWRQYDCPYQSEIHVLPAEYEATLEKLVKQTKPSLKGLVLMAPFYLEPNKNDAMRKSMDVYGDIVKKIAKKYEAIFIDTQATFDKALQYGHSAALAWDRVHPNVTGHFTIAKAFLDAVEFEWNR